MNNKLIAVVGPTASGKTGLAIEIAKRVNGEIVSCDSMQIYKGISIASAAPTPWEKTAVPHHLVEFLEPDVSFSVADYVKMARECIDDILKRGRTPVLCGGTGLYYSALVDNICFDEQPGETEIRERLKTELESSSPEEMHRRLAEIDPEAAGKLAVSDVRRVIRSLELAELTGMTAEERNALSKSRPSPYDAVVIGLTFDNRAKLYERIEQRVDEMLKNGIVDEARQRFLKIGGASQAIGHKEFFSYFRGEITLERAVEDLKTSTRRYAKRQLTWFRRDHRVNWIYADSCDDVAGRAMEIINNR